MKQNIFEVLRSINCFDIRNVDWDIRITSYDNWEAEILIYDSNNETTFVLTTLRNFGFMADEIEEMECGIKKYIWRFKIE